MLDKLIAITICPSCSSEELNLSNDSLICNDCDAIYPIYNGIIDFWPNYKGSKGLAQKTMESEFIVNIYENWIRPNFSKIGSKTNYSLEEEWIRTKLPKHSKINIDVACGTGYFTRLLHQQFNPTFSIGVDISMAMLKKAQDQSTDLENIFFIRADAANLPLKANIGTVINSSAALHLFQNPELSIREITRVASDNAHFTLMSAQSKRDTVFSRLIQNLLTVFAAFNFIDREQLLNQLTILGHDQLQNVSHGMALLLSSIIKKPDVYQKVE